MFSLKVVILIKSYIYGKNLTLSIYMLNACTLKFRRMSTVFEDLLMATEYNIC